MSRRELNELSPSFYCSFLCIISSSLSLTCRAVFLQQGGHVKEACVSNTARNFSVLLWQVLGTIPL